MEAPSAFKFPARESSPLHPLSPERVNGRSKYTRSADSESQSSPAGSPTRKANLFAEYHPITTTPTKSIQLGGGIPQSPSLPEFTSLRSTHVRTNSDVQGLVKRFEHLDVRDRDAEVEKLRKKHEMELRRAQLGREEAESDARKWRDEFRRVDKMYKEGEDRQSKVSNRLEKVMTDYSQSKEQYAAHSEAYQKEVRKARKEAFKSASAVLKLQESLRDMQKRLEVSKIDQSRDVQKARDFEQDAVDARCALANVQQDMQQLEKRLQISEEEKEELKKHLQEEEVARIAAEGKIALPVSQEDDEDFFASPLRSRSPAKADRSPLSDDKENLGIATKKVVENQCLQEIIDAEIIRREAAEEMVDFLRMECAFRCCQCATSSNHSRAMRLSMDEIMASSIERMKADMAAILSPPVSDHEDAMEVETRNVDAQASVSFVQRDEEPSEAQSPEEQMPDDITAGADEPEDESMTLMAEDPVELPEQETIPAPLPTPPEPDAVNENDDTTEPTETQRTLTVPLKDSPFSTPTRPETEPTHQHSIRTITTTTRIPMHFTPVSKKTQPTPDPEDQENRPPSAASTSAIHDHPFDREAALAAIAYRRGRAKSLANGHLTPRKQMVEGVAVGGRRDVSAPALGGKKGGVSYAKGSSSVGRAAGRGMGY